MDRKHMARGARGGPDLREIQQPAVEEGARLAQMAHWRDAANGKSRLCPDQRRVRLAKFLTGQRAGPGPIDAVSARSDEQPAFPLSRLAEHDRLCDLVKLAPGQVRSHLRGRGIADLHRVARQSRIAHRAAVTRFETLAHSMPLPIIGSIPTRRDH